MVHKAGVETAEEGEYIAKLLVESELQKRWEIQRVAAQQSAAPASVEGEERLQVLSPREVSKLHLAKVDLQIVELAIQSLHNILLNAYNKTGTR